MSLRSKRHFCERIMCPLLRLVFLSLVTSGILVNMQILPSATYQHINQLEYDDFWTCGEQNCVWNITVQENHVVQLALTYDSVCDASLSDEYGLSCACSKLEAYDGFLISNQNVLVRTCDKYWSTFGLLTTVTNNIIIVYSGFAQSSVNDILSVTYKSFNTTAVNRTCGEKLTGFKGFFSSPDYPSNYTSLLVCEWIISANPGFTIHLTINEMHLESSVDCEYDSLQVRDGNTTFAPNLWFRCGDFNPVSSADYITSTGSAMYIRFVTNWSIERRGFTANWTTATCTRTNCSSVNGGCLNEQCYCNTGYYLNTTSKTCDLIVKNSTFSNATCTCNTQNTVSCNAVNGSCTCKAGWKGDSCDVDIDECLTSLTYPCTAHAQCINVNGSYLCPCAQGYVKTQNNSCQECPPNYYGDNCNQTCNCSSNTLVCDNVNGTCKCKAGWEGIQCEKDINECTKGLHNCTYDHVNCTNTNGSYRCDCVAGYVHSSNGSCTECLPNYYGDNCNQTCNCSSNTLVCDNVNGTCKCKAGWEGVQCEVDINECATGLHNCTTDYICINTNSSYRCECHVGYLLSNNGSCIECPPYKYGKDCVQNCSCSINTLSCDKVNGSCKCKAGWEGIHCDTDINECNTGLQNCTDNNAICVNTNGSYRCDCKPGRTMNGENICTEETTTPITSTPLITTTTSTPLITTTTTTPKVTTQAATPSPSCNTTGGARKLFTLTQLNFDLNSSSTNLLVIGSRLDLSSFGNSPSVKLALYPPDSFLQIQTTDNKNFSVYTTSVMPEVTKNYHFFLEAEVVSGNEIARDFVHLTVNFKRLFPTSPPVRVSFVLDGMRKGGIIYDLSSVLGNVEGLGLTLSSNPTTNLYVFSPKQTSIVCNRDVRLSEFRSNADSIAHQHVLNISTSQGTVLTLYAVIVLNRHSKQISENSPNGTLVADFASLSNDFSISGVPTTDQIFVLTSTNVTLGQKLDYENPAQKQFKFNISLVLKSNIENKTEIETEVIVTDVNDEPPQFKKYIYSFSTWTGAARNPVIGFLEVTDIDSVSGFSYFIEPTEYTTYFEVLSTNGVLQSKQDLKNLGSSVTFNVSVSDGRNTSQQSAKVTISIFQSQNDNLTVVGNSTVVSAQEEEPPGQLITNASMANYVGYRLLPDYNGSYVTIDAGTGVITTTARLDREDSKMPQLIFSVLAYHKDNACDFKIVRKITIVITDINDNAPAFTWEGNYSTSLPENSSIGTTVFQVLASDKDFGNNASILFSLNGQSSAPFSIGSQSGIITVANPSLLDREQNDTIQVVVIAKDGGLPQKTATATLTIRLTDINDNSPVFDKNLYTFSILENRPASVIVGNVSATDKDIGLNGEIGYFYTGPDSFVVNRTSGVIRTTRPLDRELTTNYYLTINAYDNGSPRGEANCTVMITVNDVNDNAPKFERQFYLINISEANNCSQSPIATLRANDSDEGLNGQVFYTITNSVLNIDNNTGMITCKASGLDYEIPDERDFIVQVTATDRGSPSLNGSVRVRVILTDVNDNAPVFTGHPYNVSLPKQIFGTPNATIYVVSATDRDSSENGAVFYTLTATVDEVVNLLWMDTNTGVIRVNKTASTFQRTSYEFLVVASDRGHPPRTDNTSLILNVLNDVNQTIKFSQSDFRITIEEEKPPNLTASVGKLESSPAGPQAKFTLAKNSVLYVNTSSGDLFCNVTLDRETLASYEILATVADETSHSYAMVFVTVSDVNDHPPKFLLSEIQMVTDIEENSLIGTSIFIITAEDADAGNNSIVSYYLPQTNIPFAVGVSDGQLTVNGTLDRERSWVHEVVIVAKDNGFPPLESNATVTIYIKDVNDNAPTFLPPEITPIPEDASWNRPTWSAVVQAIDPDYGMNGTVKYTVLNTQACPFKINDVGKLSLQDGKTLDYETTTSHTCIIQASDSPDSGALSTNITVIINVTDVNDNDPVFQHVIKSHNVSRDVGIPYPILANLSVTDADSGINAEIWFDIDNSTFAFDIKSYFDINAVSGEIKIQKPLSDFPLESVNLTIVARDKGEPARTGTTQIEVFVSDENTPPTFSQDVYSINITEEDYRVLLQPLITVRAYDYENQTLVNSCNCTYAILDAKAESGLSVSNYFNIGSSTGTITLNRDFLIDREMTGNSIGVKLTVTDKGMPPKTATSTLSITVSDINDNAPLFSSESVDTTITKSKCKHRQVIYNATARDADFYPNNILSYRLNSQQSLSFTGIEVSEKTGELSLIYPNCSNENIENERIWVVISATDGKYNTSLTIFISVNLSDSNPNGPVFSKQLYYTTVPSSAPNGTTLQIPDFGVTDNDGNNVTFAIEKNNLKCTEDVFRINSASGKITLQNKLDQFSLKAINLTITAADYGDFSPRYSKTGTTTVFVTVSDYTEKVCIATDKADELQSKAEQFTVFRGLFIAIVLLWAITIVVSVALFYKWRVVRYNLRAKQSDTHTFDFPPLDNDAGKGSKGKADTTGLPPELPRREGSHGISSGDSGFRNPAFSIDQDKDGYLAPSEHGTSTGQFSSADSILSNLSLGSSRDTYAGGAAYMPLLPEGKTTFSQPTYLTPSSVIRGKADDPKGTYLHAVPEEQGPEKSTYLHATVKPDDIKPYF